MKEFYTVGEFAKLGQTTTETLRHYDRIDLFKPTKVDENTGYRYYHLLQNEQLSTIRELRQLGMSIEEIKSYFNNRNLESSKMLLRQKHKELIDHINELKELEKVIGKKIDHLDSLSHIDVFGKVLYKELEPRYVLVSNNRIVTEMEFDYTILELEQQLLEVAPLVASNRVGVIAEAGDIINEDYEKPRLFLEVENVHNYEPSKLHKVNGGQYACILWKSDYLQVKKYFLRAQAEINSQGMDINGPILHICQIDISVTEDQNEEIFELQIPIKKR